MRWGWSGDGIDDGRGCSISFRGDYRRNLGFSWHFGENSGDSGDEIANYPQLLLLPTHCFIRKEGGPIERSVAFHPHYPHCFSFYTRKEREDIGKQHEMTPGGSYRCPGHPHCIPTASPLFAGHPHCPLLPAGAPRRHRQPRSPRWRGRETSPGCKGGIGFL